jgi:hypothetical protein
MFVIPERSASGNFQVLKEDVYGKEQRVQLRFGRNR